MAWPFRKEPDQTESAEDKKKREDAEQTEFFSKIETLVKNQVAPLSASVTEIQDKWKKLEESANAEVQADANKNDAELTAEQRNEQDKKKLLALSIATNARITENDVLNEASIKFPEFVPKIQEYFNGTALERKGQADYPQYCRNIVKLVVGDAAINGGLRYDTEGKKFFLEDASGKNEEGDTFDFLAPDMAWQDPRSGKILSGREQLAKLGIKPEEFADSVKRGVV